MRTVGVLGGMGPEATVLFMSRVLDSVDALDDADHVPLLVDQNPQVPSRIDAILRGGADPGPVLAAMARRLAEAGAEALVMPCNTAHRFAPQVRATVSVPFIDMVALAADRAAELTPNGTIGLLGSPAMIEAGVFDGPLAARGLRTVPLADPGSVLGTIRRIKAGGAHQAAAETLGAEVRAMRAAGADAICIACTEFSLMAELLPSPIPVFDALDLAVGATVRFARDGQLPEAHAATADKDGPEAVRHDIRAYPRR